MNRPVSHLQQFCLVGLMLSFSILSAHTPGGLADDSYNVDHTHASDYSVKVNYDLSEICLTEFNADVNLTTNPDGGTFIVSYNTAEYHSHYLASVGPGYNQTLYAWANHFGVLCFEKGNVVSLTCTTDSIYDPIDVSATDGILDTAIMITWNKGTHIPDDKHGYRIYRNGSLIATLAGDVRTYTDSPLLPGNSYTYKVTTFTQSFGTHESPGATDMGSTFSVGLQATDGEFYGKTKLTWNDLSEAATDIRVERSIPGISSREELAILNKHATSYTDTEGIPGYPYTYYVTPIGNAGAFLTGSDMGYSKPDGKITGHVYSQQGAGVDSVEIYVELISTIPQGGAALPPCTTTYCALTDVSGFFEIENVYYYTEAEFRIYPTKGTHIFDPDTVIRKLNENTPVQNLVDFTDLNVITVSGRVTYPAGPGSGGACGVEGVSILINNRDIGILTDANGEWSTTLDNGGTYTFSAKLFDHVFRNAMNQSTTTLHINADKAGIDFEDKTVRTIHVVAQGGCQASLGDSVAILITAPGNCFQKTYYTDQFGLLTIDDLPPRDYTIEVTDVDGAGSSTSAILAQIGNIPVEIDLTELDTMLIITEADSLQITPADTTILPDGTQVITPSDTMLVHYKDTSFSTEKEIRFIYRAPIEVTVDFEDAGAEVFTCGSTTHVVVDQDRDYLLEFNVKEMFSDCYIDTGTLVIYDEVGDKASMGQKIPISNGIARYLLEPGNPDIAASSDHSHEKFIYIVPKIDFADVEPATFWLVVTGIKSNTPTFITRTPEIPQLIIHDPPGDNSFTTIEKGTTFTTMSSTQVQVGGDAGVYLNFKAGPAANVFAAKVKAGAAIQLEARAGRDNFDNDVIINTITFLENFSTSSDETFIGEQGDVYIGSALNQTFALSQELVYDGATCSASVDTVVEMGFTGFATTFIYTEYHLKNSLLPTLHTLKELQDTTTEEGKKEYNRLINDINLWNAILENNAAARDSGVFEENISISAGAEYTRTKGSTTGINNSYTYEIFLDTELKVGAYAEIESPFNYLSLEGGVMGRFRYSTTEVRDTLDESVRNVSFTISDNDIGDFFSIDILRDTVYDVPAFRLKSGTSSCPHEHNTQPREVPAISVFPPVVNNVPPDEAAQFVLEITNLSESGETRQYAVKVVPSSNPDGAIVNVAGSDINVFPVDYFFDANQTLNLSMSVYKGPLASNYDSIGIMIYSECEYDIWSNGGNLTQADTTWFSVNFLSECTNVSMHLPNDGWLVNQSSQNTLHVAFTGYDINNPFFTGITLQMKRDGYGYVNQVTIPKEELLLPYYDYFFDVSGFPDGRYTLRARANCGLDGGYTYSSEVSGIIDRTSLAPFGIPTPSDGFLREGQEVSVTFDKVINCQFDQYDHEITLIREDTGTPIPFTTSCFGNKVIINTDPPLLEQHDLEGVLVTARVHRLRDENDNVQEYPTQWSFLVNVSPVFWDPDLLFAWGLEGEQHTITGVLKNTSLLSKAFSLDTADGPNIISYPAWLIPVQKRGTILPENAYRVEFHVDPGLRPGLYSGTVTAMIDSLPVSMDVTFELLARPVHWPFDPGAYQYTMNVVAQFSLNDSDTLLSEDSRDLIGAFVNGEVRGIANIEYVEELDVYRAFLTIYSNIQGGGGAETVRFRFWHALNGVEYGALETITFTLDGTVGTLTQPLILHPEGFFQVIPLNKGWTWISLNVQTDNMSREHLFQSILNSPSGNSITLKSKTQTAQYSPGSGWNGSLSTLNLAEGYLVFLSNAPDTLRVVGFPSATEIQVPVVNNWNWIGFPRLTPEPVNEVLAGLSGSANDILKSQYKFASYSPTEGAWLGNLIEFTPGQGYKLRLANAGTISFQPSRSDEYAVDPHLYEYSMNVTGDIDLSLIGETSEEDLVIGAFIGGECRGVATLEFIETLGEYRALLLVHGNVTDLGKRIEFRVKNTFSGVEYLANGQPLDFTADGIVGIAEEPYQFFEISTDIESQYADGYALGQSIPNPTQGKVSIGFTLPVSAHATLNIYDITGTPVMTIADAEFHAGRHQVEADLSALSPGVYYYELRTNTFSGVKKLVKQ